MDKIFKMMDDVVEEVREDNVIQIVIDNATNYKSSWRSLNAKERKKIVLNTMCKTLH